MEQFREATLYNEEGQYEEIINFEDELKVISNRFEKKEIEFREELQKNIKKASKSLQSYEEELKSLKLEISKTESNTNKLNKAL